MDAEQVRRLLELHALDTRRQTYAKACAEIECVLARLERAPVEILRERVDQTLRIVRAAIVADLRT